MKFKTIAALAALLLIGACAVKPPLPDPNYPYGMNIPVKPDQSYHQ